MVSAQRAALQGLEGQILLRLGEVHQAQRLLQDAFAVLVGSDLRNDAVVAGIALLLAGARPGKVAAQILPLVPQLWRQELASLLEDVARTGRVRPEQLGTLEKFLELPEKRE
jgi:hypothetical protein